jgi:hypothetical protein
MSKRKPAPTSKRARGPKIVARAQRNKQAVVRSPKDNPQRSVAAVSAESPAKLHDDSKREAPIAKSPAATRQDGEKIRDNNPKKDFDFSLATANVQAYQAKLLEMAQANMHFAFEFGSRLATLRTPFEFFALIAEFTSRRIDMLQKHSKEWRHIRFGTSRLESSPLRRDNDSKGRDTSVPCSICRDPTNLRRSDSIRHAKPDGRREYRVHARCGTRIHHHDLR